MSSPLRSPYSITSTQAPSVPFFRSHRTRQLSSSSFSSLDPSQSSCSEESSSSGSSSSGSDCDDFSSISSLTRAGGGSAGRRSISRAEASSISASQQQNQRSSSATPTSNSLLPSHRRVHLKLSFLILRARQGLASSSFEALSLALKQLAAALPADLRSLGAFLPILDRLASDLRVELAGEGKGRGFRKGLSKDEAKALTSLRQRWTVGGAQGEKGKAKVSSEVEWVEQVRAIVHERALPPCLCQPFDKPTSVLLGALESLLMPSSLPRISLSGLNLTSAYLANWRALERADDVLGWYLSFDREPADPSEVLGGVRSLDLSRNRLESFPDWLPTLFPGLETLSIAHCAFRFLPPTMTLFHQLRRLKSHGNTLARGHSRRGGVKHNTKEIVRQIRASGAIEDDGYVTDVESLVVSCVRVLRRTRKSRESTTPTLCTDSGMESAEEGFAVDDLSVDDRQLNTAPTRSEPLPPHLERLLYESYTCCSCDSFVPSTSTAFLPALFERVHHLDPGVALPAKLHPPSPALDPAPAAFSSRSASSSRSSSLARPLTPTLAVPPSPIAMTPASVLASSPPLSPIPSPSPSPSAGASFPPPPHRLTLEEKVLLLLIGRGLDLTTFVIGDVTAYRFCLPCARAHLGMERAGRVCECVVCSAERKRETGEDGGVMRWLRRKQGARGRA